MSAFRRVVTGHAPSGKSIIAKDAKIEGVTMPGASGTVLATLWGADDALTYPDTGAEPAHHAWFPPIGGMRFIAFTLPPDGTPPDTGVDAKQAADAAEDLFPGLVAHFDPDVPGMHRSATTDMLYVVSGRCVLELDDGSRTELGAGDVVVQSGTMHRWSNPWDEPCRFVGALVGAHLK